MIVVHKSEYNPRIDFIVCKQLLCNLPFEYDELKLRNNFIKEIGTQSYEKDILTIKKFFKNTDITLATEKDVESLYKVCTHQALKYNGEVGKVEDFSGLERVVEVVKEHNCQSVTLFQLLLLFGYCKTNTVPIMPYRGVCARIYFSLLFGQKERAEKSWKDLLYRITKYCTCHPLEQNHFCLSQLKVFKDEFLKSTGGEKLGIYGSLSCGTDTEYSDADIIVVIKNETDAKKVKKQAIKFWADKLPIHYDLCITTEDGLKSLPIGIRSTVKFL